jgi:hypothetical protein
MQKTKSLAIISFILYATICSQCFSAEYRFPTSLRIGTGLNPSEPLESYPYCFDYNERIVSGSAPTSSFRATVIKDRKHFLRELNVSASASGSYAIFSGNASISIDERYSFDSDNLTWLVLFSTDLGRKEIFNERPKSFAQKLLDDKNYVEFAIRCGSELITQEHRQVSVAAVYSMKNLTVEQKSQLESKLEGGATASAWGAKITSSFKNFINEASRSSKINVDILVIMHQRYHLTMRRQPDILQQKWIATVGRGTLLTLD